VSNVRNFHGSATRLGFHLPPVFDGLKDAKSAAVKEQTARVKTYLRNWSGNTAVAVRKRAEGFTAATEVIFSQLGSQLNRATGYEDIELLKKNVVEQEARINVSRAAATAAKRAYEEAVVRRSQSQREVNELLQRKSVWTDADVGRFTTLVREDHLYEQNEAKAKERVAESDAEVERELNELLKSILSRYHEEQVWSDKIRSASTYGSMAALGLNLLVFIMATLVVEPWKRRRLAHTFEKKVEELSAQTGDLIQSEIQKVNLRLGDLELRSSTPSNPPPEIIVSAVSPPSPAPEPAVDPLTQLERMLNKVDWKTVILAVAVCSSWFR